MPEAVGSDFHFKSFHTKTMGSSKHAKLPDDDQVVSDLTRKITRRERAKEPTRTAGSWILFSTSALAVVGAAALGVVAGLGLFTNPIGWAVLGAIAIAGIVTGVALVATNRGEAFNGVVKPLLIGAGVGAAVSAIVVILGFLAVAGVGGGFDMPSFGYGFGGFGSLMSLNLTLNMAAIGLEGLDTEWGEKNASSKMTASALHDNWRLQKREELFRDVLARHRQPETEQTDTHKLTKQALSLGKQFKGNEQFSEDEYKGILNQCIQAYEKRRADRAEASFNDYKLMAFCVTALNRLGEKKDADILYQVCKSRLSPHFEARHKFENIVIFNKVKTSQFTSLSQCLHGDYVDFISKILNQDNKGFHAGNEVVGASELTKLALMKSKDKKCDPQELFDDSCVAFLRRRQDQINFDDTDVILLASCIKALAQQEKTSEALLLHEIVKNAISSASMQDDRKAQRVLDELTFPAFDRLGKQMKKNQNEQKGDEV